MSGGNQSPNMTQTMSTTPGAGGAGLGSLINTMFGQFGVQTDPGGGFAGKDRKRYAQLLNLRGQGKRYGKQARLEERLGLSPGGVPGAGGAMPDLTSVQLNPELNPFLQDTFNRAADLTRTRLSSEFAGMGRNPEAALPARSQELQHLAGSIFDPAYLAQFDPTQTLINRILPLIGASGTNMNMTQKKGVYQQGLF